MSVEQSIILILIVSVPAVGQEQPPPAWKSPKPREGRDGADAACLARIASCYREFVTELGTRCSESQTST